MSRSKYILVLAIMVICNIHVFGCQSQETFEQAKSSATANESASAQQDQDKQDPKKAHAHSKKYTNSLAKETSPYLLQHAHNPVNWYAWNDETLSLAKMEDKPIFLSIGYSSCHWCHVMERESFLDEEIADFLNENFVCIKVDREERPDVDAIYMEALTRMRRRGGWPLSMFMTPDGKPFFGGTYFPARDGDRGQSTGFETIIRAIDDGWSNNRNAIIRDAEEIAELTRAALQRAPTPNAKIQPIWITMCMNGLKDNFDPIYGGFRFSEANAQIPKFPEPSNLLFLADVLRREPNNLDAKNMYVTTCERMMMGGIFDHIDGGFHRYSVDRFWAIPHFEKMLYDNGQLLTVYSEAYEITGRPDFKNVIERSVEWLKREMISDDGGFYSALDAESEGEEGKFNRWTLEEIKQVLSEDEYKFFAPIYRLDEAPNFEGQFYAPQLKNSPAFIAKQKSMTIQELENRLAPMRKKLFDVRSKRERPMTDNKILTSWNGMMIRGLADAGRVLKNKEYIQLAKNAAEFAQANLIQKDGRLWRTNTNGQSKLNAYLDDYSSMIDGLIGLHRATKEKKWLDLAIKLQAKQDELFQDPAGGYYFTSNDHEQLLARVKKPVDGAVPSGNSVAALNLIYLAEATGDEKYLELARNTVIGASGLLDQYPLAAPRLLIAVKKLSELEKK